MREIIFDVEATSGETTGLEATSGVANNGDRIIEIGALEMPASAISIRIDYA